MQHENNVDDFMILSKVILALKIMDSSRSLEGSFHINNSSSKIIGDHDFPIQFQYWHAYTHIHIHAYKPHMLVRNFGIKEQTSQE